MTKKLTFASLLDEAQAELDEENRTMAKDKIKSRLKELNAAQKTILKLKRSFERLLETGIVDADDVE